MMTTTIDLERADLATLSRLASEEGIDTQEAARRILLVGLRMFPGVVCEVGFHLMMDVRIEHAAIVRDEFTP